MTSRERVQCALNHEETDRVPIHDSPWKATIDRWHAEGLPPEVAPDDYFGYEIVGFGADTSPRMPIRVIDETDEYVIATNPYGGVRKNHKDFSTTPEVIDYPCRNREDWDNVKQRLVPSEDRFQTGDEWLVGIGDNDLRALAGASTEPGGLARCRAARAQGKFVCYEAIVGYDKMEHYVKTEELLMAIATDPDWIRDMYEADATMVIEMHRRMEAAGYEFDGAWLMCDLGYRNGLLFSVRHFHEQLRPTFQRLFGYFRSRGMPVILHSCGQVTKLIPYLIEDGLSCLQPIEVKAGMDLVELKEAFGARLAFMGGIDVRAMSHRDTHAIEREIRAKIPIARKGGGYIYHSDHSVPNDVSFSQYRRVMELVRRCGGNPTD